jgi:hypothetical protein
LSGRPGGKPDLRRVGVSVAGRALRMPRHLRSWPIRPAGCPLAAPSILSLYIDMFYLKDLCRSGHKYPCGDFVQLSRRSLPPSTLRLNKIKSPQSHKQGNRIIQQREVGKKGRTAGYPRDNFAAFAYFPACLGGAHGVVGWVFRSSQTGREVSLRA